MLNKKDRNWVKMQDTISSLLQTSCKYEMSFGLVYKAQLNFLPLKWYGLDKFTSLHVS